MEEHGENGQRKVKKKVRKHRTQMYLELAKGMQESMSEEKLAQLKDNAQMMRGPTANSLVASTEADAESPPMSPLHFGQSSSSTSRLNLLSPPASQSKVSLLTAARIEQRALSLEHRPGNEIINRIRSWGLGENRSFNANSSRFDCSQLRAIDMSKWAEGSSFKLAKKDDWYDADRIVTARNFFRTNFRWQVVIIIAIFIALFLADTFVIFQVPGNMEQDFTMTIVYLIFMCEFIGLSLVDQEYPRSYYFWVDLIGLISLLFDISYLGGHDAMAPEVFIKKDATMSQHAARLARQSARAGRVCRVLKITKYVADVLYADDAIVVNMAHVISEQITDAITTRVAFLTAFLALVLPFFFLFGRLAVDESIAAWSQLVSKDFSSYEDAVLSNATDLLLAARHLLQEDLHLLNKFYAEETYAPYKVCYRGDAKDHFKCDPDMFGLDFAFGFKEPVRRSSILLYSSDRVRCFFNVVASKQSEASINIVYLLFIVALMVMFGFLLKSSVTWIALLPLEKMLSVVRERSQEILKLASDLQPGQESLAKSRSRETLCPAEAENEFVLLEKAFSKFSALSNLGTPAIKEVDEIEVLDQNDILLRNLRGLRSDNDNDRELLIQYRISRISRVSTATGKNHIDEDDEEQEHDRLAWFTFKIPSHILEFFGTWDFDAFALTKPNTSLVASYILFSCRGCQDWVKDNVPQNTILKFIPVLESHYLPNTFHNFGHATDVCYSMSYYCNYFESDAILGELTMFWLLVASIGHDVGHVGVNNGFLVETSHPFALTYNDRSPLENMHCATLFQLLALPEANVFCAIEQAIVKEARKGMIVAILHTDIVQHGRLVRDFSLLYQMNIKTIDQQDSAYIDLLKSNPNHQLIVNLMMHCCDVGNPLKPWPMCFKIASLVMEEYFNQGDKEKEAEIPVQMLNDRDRVNKPNSQIGFIEFLIAPMVETVVKVFPGMSFVSENLAFNLKSWLSDWIDESLPPEEEIERTKNRVEKVLASITDSGECMIKKNSEKSMKS